MRDEIEDYYTISGALEGLAARLAIERASPEEVEHLRELHKTLKEACQKRDLAYYFDANNRFHRFIAEIARNERLYRLVDQLRQDIQKTRILALRSPQRLEVEWRFECLANDFARHFRCLGQRGALHRNRLLRLRIEQRQ